MKHFCLMLLALLLLCCCAPANALKRQSASTPAPAVSTSATPVPVDGYGRVTREEAELHLSPSDSSPVRKILHQGEIVKMMEYLCDAEGAWWVHADYADGMQGYLRSGFLQEMTANEVKEYLSALMEVPAQSTEVIPGDAQIEFAYRDGRADGLLNGEPIGLDGTLENIQNSLTAQGVTFTVDERGENFYLEDIKGLSMYEKIPVERIQITQRDGKTGFIVFYSREYSIGADSSVIADYASACQKILSQIGPEDFAAVRCYPNGYSETDKETYRFESGDTQPEDLCRLVQEKSIAHKLSEKSGYIEGEYAFAPQDDYSHMLSLTYLRLAAYDRIDVLVEINR